jgi:hypothetical protein
MERRWPLLLRRSSSWPGLQRENKTKRRLPSGMKLARALVFLRGIDLLSCVYCAA